MTEEANEAASKYELADRIAVEHGHAQNQEFIRERLKQYCDAAIDPEDPEQQRERLRAIELICLKAMEAVWFAPQELDWLSGGIRSDDEMVDSTNGEGDALAELNELSSCTSASRTSRLSKHLPGSIPHLKISTWSRASGGRIGRLRVVSGKSHRTQLSDQPR
jgi:hypothetical protein